MRQRMLPPARFLTGLLISLTPPIRTPPQTQSTRIQKLQLIINPATNSTPARVEASKRRRSVSCSVSSRTLCCARRLLNISIRPLLELARTVRRSLRTSTTWCGLAHPTLPFPPYPTLPGRTGRLPCLAALLGCSGLRAQKALVKRAQAAATATGVPY